MPIIRTDTANGFVLAYNTLTVEITNDNRFFTIYDGDKPVGTIIRPSVIGGERRWNVYRADGSFITGGVGPRYCFARFISRKEGTNHAISRHSDDTR